ncbi:MAG: TIGR02266 family protein [Deltaproteobacteria bacterium]|nr:TIGR02266 family protein [Deltaproteobacteria bacterium]
MSDAEAADSGDERRRHPRAPLQLLIQYRFDTFEEFLAEYSTDLSVGGMFIKTNEPREEGAFVYLQFALKDGSRLIEGLGRVVRVNLPGDPAVVAGMGVEFVNFDADSMALIEEIVARRLAQHRAG